MTAGARSAPSCRSVNKTGEPCRAPRLRDGEFCFWHSPECAREAAEARKLGGLRRRKEATIQGAYELDGLARLQQAQARRWIEIAAVDTLALENSIARSRTLAYLAQVATRNYETTELTDRVRAMENVLKQNVA